MSRFCLLSALAYLLSCSGTPEPAPADTEDTALSLAAWRTLDATATCAPAAQDTCGLPAVAPGHWTAYRKDHHFPDEVYQEYTEAPLDGGRVHVVATAAATGTITQVTVDGLDIQTLDTPAPATPPPLDWAHVWPEQVVAGQPVWVSFHSREARWDRPGTGRVVVQTDGGVAVEADITVATSPLLLTAVTTADDGATRVLFVRNDSPDTVTLDRIVLDGIDATDAACLASPELSPGQTARITVPLCTPASPGDLWSVVITSSNGLEAVAGGRVVPERFPIEAWNNTTECPWPGGNDDNAAAMSAMGIDTHYLHGGVCNESRCDCDEQQLIEDVYGADDTLMTVVTRGVASELPDSLDTSGIAAFSTGDESDGELFEDDPESPDFGAPKPAIRARQSRELWARFPQVPTFNGGMTNGHIGSFAGMSDIQGMDVYIGACAPHITQWGEHPPVRMPFDYLRNARNNHMPLPTWLYTQGMSPAWSTQPVASEITVQAFEAIAAGAKGLMWFQANLEAAETHPDTRDAIRDANRLVGALREELRVADPTGAAGTSLHDDTTEATSDSPVLVEQLRSARALHVISIQLQADVAPDDLTCLGLGVPHEFATTTTDIWTDVPADMAVSQAFELTASGPVDLDLQALGTEGRRMWWRGMTLDDATPVRWWVLTDDPQLRSELAAAWPQE
jgi:hypothetical protein